MKRIGIFFLFFIILVPAVDAVPIIEIFVDEKTPSNQNIPHVVVSSIENGDLELFFGINQMKIYLMILII